MKERVVNFIRLLRESNIRISIAESIEACRALQLCEIYEKEQFKIALMSTLIKQSSDLATFNKIFDLYFIEPIEKEQKIELSEQDFQTLMQELEEQMQNDDFNDLKGQNSQTSNSNKIPDEFENQFQRYDKNKIAKDLFKNGSESDLQQTAKKLANSRNFEDWESEDINRICQSMLIQNEMEYGKALAKQETRKSQHEDVEEKYEKLKKYLKEEIEKALVKQFGDDIIADLIENNNIMDKDLGELSIEELEKIEEIIKKIAKKLATHVSRKEKHSKKGKINIRKTIRTSIQYGNTSSELRFKNKKKNKNELVVLCDISGSVWQYVTFMLQLVIGIQYVFKKVNSYIFIDTIRNVTEDILTSDDLRKSMDDFLNDRRLGYGTDYGNVFKIFSRERDIFNKKTVLIIMGDAENTGKDIGDDYLKEISDKCKVVYWLQPKDPTTWYNAYSELEKYKKSCKDVYQCSTLRQLEDFIKNLIKI